MVGPEGVAEPFSIYGVINPRLMRQTLLVSTIEDRLFPLESTLDAVVTSTNMTTGERFTWKDSLAANATGQRDHVFWADFRPEFGSRHRIVVGRSDGLTSSVEVIVPRLITIEQEDTGTRDFHVEVLGKDISLVSLDVVYGVRGYWVGVESERFFPYVTPYSTYTFH